MTDELISKQDLQRKFTFAPTGEKFKLRDIDNFPVEVQLKAVQDEIKKAPEVIVRCRDCIHRNSKLDKNGSTHIACYLMNPDDFCSYGERR